jgi:phage/plasmid-associated DNA primase
MLNIDEECPKDELTNSTLRSLKNICSETSKIQYEEKNKRPISEHCTTKLVFITNHNFKISSTADVAVLERILVITFEKVQKAYSDVITKNIASKE